MTRCFLNALNCFAESLNRYIGRTVFEGGHIMDLDQVLFHFWLLMKIFFLFLVFFSFLDHYIFTYVVGDRVNFSALFVDGLQILSCLLYSRLLD